MVPLLSGAVDTHTSTSRAYTLPLLRWKEHRCYNYCKRLQANLSRLFPPKRRLERRLPASGLERGPGCHPERSEGSLRQARQILRCAQDDRPSLQISTLQRGACGIFLRNTPKPNGVTMI